MPNHCYNKLTCTDGSFETSTAEYLSLDEEDGQPYLDFQKILPMPADLAIAATPGTADEVLKQKYADNLKTYGFESWYDWCVANWGTKWNSYDARPLENGMSFDTAWSPPLPVIAALSKLTQKSFILEYLEEGVGFIGRFSVSPQGHVDECYNLDKAPDELKDSLGYVEYIEEEVEI